MKPKRQNTITNNYTSLMLSCIGLVLFTCCAEQATTQNLDLTTSRDRTYGYVEYEIPPHYPGGISAWTQHVRNKINQPKVNGRFYTGTVFLNFIVKTDSTVNHIKVVKEKVFTPPMIVLP